MRVGAQLSVTDKRRASRHPVNYKVIAEHRQLGPLQIHIINVSSQGLMTKGTLPLECGERLAMRLPTVGNIEVHMIWSHEDRCGFQFERIIRNDDFLSMVEILQPNPRLRPKR